MTAALTQTHPAGGAAIIAMPLPGRAPPAVEAPRQCRPGCGACCIAISISSPIPGHPQGKAAGVRCVQLADDLRCRIFGRPERPAVCGGLKPQAEMCGEAREHALVYLAELERLTAP